MEGGKLVKDIHWADTPHNLSRMGHAAAEIIRCTQFLGSVIETCPQSSLCEPVTRFPIWDQSKRTSEMQYARGAIALDDEMIKLLGSQSESAVQAVALLGPLS